MSDFDDLLNGIKKGLSELAEDAQEKYNDLTNYLDTHNADEIKRDLKEIADKTTSDAKEQLEKAKNEWNEVDVNEKVADMKEDFQEGIDKAKIALGEGIDVVQKQFAELKKRFNL